MEKIGFIHFAFIYVPIEYYYVVAWCKWQEMDFQPKPIKIHWFWFSNRISQIDSLLFGAAQFVSSLLINIQNNDAIHEYSWLGNGLLLVQLMFTTNFFFLLFFFSFTFRWRNVQRACGARLCCKFIDWFLIFKYQQHAALNFYK